MVSWDALDALSHALELNDIDASTRVVALIDHADDGLASLLRVALARTRAEALDVRLLRDGPAELERLRSGRILAGLVDNVDVVIDALPEAGIGPELVVGSGARMLRLLPSAIHAAQWAPHASLATRVGNVADTIARSRTVTVFDDHGTDLVVTLDAARISADGGRGELAGSTTWFPSGWVRLTPGAGTVEGDLVLMPGDGLLAQPTHLRSPIRLSIRQDRVVRIEGDHNDGDLLRALFEAMETDDAYGVAELSLGLHAGGLVRGGPFDPAVADPGLAPLAGGVVGISFGDNLHADRPCPTTIALALPRRSLRTDDTELCTRGVLAGEAAPDVYERAE